jgi:hypothetical protein
VVHIARKYLGPLLDFSLGDVTPPPPPIQRIKIEMILRYKYTVKKLKAKENLKLRVDRLQAMTGIIYEPLFTRKTLLSNKLYNILSPNILL